VSVALKLVSAQAPKFLQETQERYLQVDDKKTKKSLELLPLKIARSKKYQKNTASIEPEVYGIKHIENVLLEDLISRINWKMFALAWQIKQKSKENKIRHFQN
jgi:cobalamin-dependent methionine synthase I